jgi:hypothetical protein
LHLVQHVEDQVGREVEHGEGLLDQAGPLGGAAAGPPVDVADHGLRRLLLCVLELLLHLGGHAVDEVLPE